MPEEERNTNHAEHQDTDADHDEDLPKISSASSQGPIPEPHNETEVNFCRTVGCRNFGVPPVRANRGRGRPRPDQYRVVGGGGGTGALFCFDCNKSTILKSNAAVHEEFSRITSVLDVEHPLRCPSATCVNHIYRGASARQFRRNGSNRHGTPRWECRACRKTFSLSAPLARQRKSHVNRNVFMMLMNGTPFRRICEILSITPTTLYAKIDWLAKQCRLYTAWKESRLPQMEFERLYLCTDRQDYLVNWDDRRTRRTIQLTAIGTADRQHHYLFGFTLNFDPDADPEEVERLAEAAGDPDVMPHLRRFARLWTQADYRRAERQHEGRAVTDDVEVDDGLGLEHQLPRNGMQVHAEYTMHGHFQHLRRLLQGVNKVRFYIDEDAGLQTAIISAFEHRFRTRQAELFMVKIAKNLSNPERERLVALEKKRFNEEKDRVLANWNERRGLPPDEVVEPPDHEIVIELLAEQVSDIRQRHPDDPWPLRTRWVSHPDPHTGEPSKKVRFLSDMNDYGDEHIARLVHRASLLPIDTVFNQVRARISVLGRPGISVRARRATYNRYGAYNPALLDKLLTIYRCWHNFVWTTENGQSPAERMSLSKGKVRVEDIIYFDIRDYI